jgi:ribonuclease inhibitor
MLVEVNGAEVRTALDFHRALERLLDFGPYYGRNLDALWDRLSTDVERPVELIWRDAAVSRRQLGISVFDDLCGVLDRVVEHDAALGRKSRFAYVLV